MGPNSGNNNNNNNQYIYKQRQSHAMSQRRWCQSQAALLSAPHGREEESKGKGGKGRGGERGAKGRGRGGERRGEKKRDVGLHTLRLAVT